MKVMSPVKVERTPIATTAKSFLSSALASALLKIGLKTGIVQSVEQI
jgi:hypothetical protein